MSFSKIASSQIERIKLFFAQADSKETANMKEGIEKIYDDIEFSKQSVFDWLIEHIDDKLSYEERRDIIYRINKPYINSKKYLSAVEDYLQNKNVDSLNARENWFSFIDSLSRDFLNVLFSSDDWTGHKLTINLALWSFTDQSGMLPVYRHHVFNVDLTPKERERLILERNDSFRSLKETQKEYSFLNEVVPNSVSQFFMFDRTIKKENEMHIYELDTGKDGLTRELGLVTLISRKNINTNYLSNLKNNENLDIIYNRRTQGPDEEKEYQYRVIMWMIRSGIFNPLKVKRLPSDNNFYNLLSKSPRSIEFIKILSDQYGSSLLKCRQNAANNKEILKSSDVYTLEDDEKISQIIEDIDSRNHREIDKRIATFESGFFGLTQFPGNQINYIYWVPISVTWGKTFKGGGVLFLNSSGENPKDSFETSKIWSVQRRLIKALYSISGLIGNEQNQEISKRYEVALNNSAAVKIMSGNISHNIGSHVIAYLKQELVDANKNIIENARLASFLSYLQERQDYISIFASNKTPYFSSVNVYEHVLQYFTKGQERKNKEQNILLEYLVRSEGYSGEEITFNYSQDDLQSCNVALPTGIAGRQAIFAIFENFIRNSAKHGKSKNSGRNRINIVFKQLDVEGKEYYKFQLKGNSGNLTKSTIKNIADILNDPLIEEETGVVDERHRGIKEMQISAAWLRGVKPHEIISYNKREDGKFKLLEVKLEDEKDLCYEFYLKRARSVLIVLNDTSSYIDKNRNFTNGLERLNDDWSLMNISEAKEYSSTLSYRFVVFGNRLREKKYREDRKTVAKFSPARIFTIAINSLKWKSPEDAVNIIYSSWLNSTSEKGSYNRFDLHRELNVKPTEMYIGIFDPRIESNESSSDKIVIDDKYRLPPKGREGCEILFRIHNDNKDDFNRFREFANGKPFKNAVFIEGVTGDNSTSRLIKEKIKGEYWRLKIIESALTKILIIDERIWQKITGIRNLTKIPSELENAINYFKDDQIHTDDEESKKNVFTIFKYLKNQESKQFERIAELIMDLWNENRENEIYSFLEPLISGLDTMDPKKKDYLNYKFELFKKKGIEVWHFEAVDDKLVIVDLQNNEVGFLNKEGEIEIKNQKQDKTCFHFVSLHQGIIDKMLKIFKDNPIVSNLPEVTGQRFTKNNPEAIIKLFTGFRNKIHAEFRYLIHSGRIRGPIQPPDTAFIQYSSLEYALFDSKFTLTEMLYSATLD